MNYGDLPIILLFLENTYIIKTTFETRTNFFLISQPRYSCFSYLAPQTFIISLFDTIYSSDIEGHMGHFGDRLTLLVKEMDHSAK
jgi:hypothetical protein